MTKKRREEPASQVPDETGASSEFQQLPQPKNHPRCLSPRESLLEKSFRQRHEVEQLQPDLVQRCSEFGLRPTPGPFGVTVRLSAGKEEVEIPLDLETAEIAIDFMESLSAELCLLCRYAGIVKADEGYIEALIEDIRLPLSLSTYIIDRNLFPPLDPGRGSGQIHAVVDGTNINVEISPASVLFKALKSRIWAPRDPIINASIELITIKISEVPLKDHDRSDDLLAAVAGALSFDLESTFGAGFILCRRLEWKSFSRRNLKLQDSERKEADKVHEPINLQLNLYDDDVMSYYWHARRVEEVPLAAYLGYYQVLEYHFERYTHKEPVKILRQQLADPLLDIDNEQQLTRVVTLLCDSISLHQKEIQQLTATLLNCLDVDEVERFISSDKSLERHVRRKDKLPGIPSISPSLHGEELLKTLAQRIYRLRCQIVHAKDKVYNGETLLLVPDSTAASRIRDEIKLVRFVAQRVTIASSGMVDLARMQRGCG